MLLFDRLPRSHFALHSEWSLRITCPLPDVFWLPLLHHEMSFLKEILHAFNALKDR